MWLGQRGNISATHGLIALIKSVIRSFSVQVCEEKIKKSWAVVDAESHQKDDVKRDTVYCLSDDNETEVQKDDVIQGERLILYNPSN